MSSPVLLAVVKAEYAYEAQTEDELTISEDQVLYVLEDDDADWWKVRLKTAPSEDASAAPSGLVPARYVQPLPALAHVTSLYAYDPQNDEELAAEEDEPLTLYERDGDWILVGRTTDGHRGVGYIPATWIEQPDADVETYHDAEEETAPGRDLSPEPIKAGPSGAAFSPPPKRSIDRPPPDDVQTWNVTEVDAKKKKKKGTLGIGNGALYFAGESDKKPVQQHPLADLVSHSTEKGKHLYLNFSETQLHYSVPTRESLEEIVASLEEAGVSASNAVARQHEEPSPPRANLSGYSSPRTHHSDRATDVSVATVMYDFTGEAEDELSVVDGERVVVLDSSADDWWKVQRTDGSGEEGVVPASYIEVDNGSGDHPRPDEDDRAGVQERSRTRSEADLPTAKSASAAATAARNRAETVRREEDKRRVSEGIRPAEPPPLAKRPSTKAAETARDRAGSTSKVRFDTDGKSDTADRDTKKPTGTIRTWRDRTGQFKVEAEYLGVQNGKVRLHKLNGVIIAVPLAKMSAEDTDYLRQFERKGAKGHDASDRSRASPKSQIKNNERTAPLKKPQIDWFDFFLSAGCDMDDCTRYARNFERDRIDETIIDDLESGTLRSLGLREGDVVRVLKHIRAQHELREMPPDAAREAQLRKDEELARELHERETGERLPMTRDGAGLFTNASGGLKSTRRGRPIGGRTAPEKVTADVLTVNPDQRGRLTPDPLSRSPGSTSPLDGKRSSSTTPMTSGFDDDAWTNRPSPKPNTPAPPPAAPIPPLVPVAAVEPPRPASATSASGTSAQHLNDSILAQMGITNRPPSAPASRTVATASPAVQSDPNAPRGPLAPVAGNAPLLNPLVPTQTGNLGFVPTRPGGATSPMVAQATGFQTMAPMMTTYQQPVMAQPTGMLSPPPTSMSYNPMTQTPTGHLSRHLSLQQTGMVHTQPPLSHHASFGQPQQPPYQPHQPYQHVMPQQTGFSTTPAAPQMPPQATGYSSPAPSVQSQSSVPGRFDPANVFGSMKTGSFGKDAHKEPQPEEKYNALRPQMTGFAPGGLVSQPTGVQPSGVFAGWQHNPMGQQPQPSQQQYYQQYTPY